MDNTMGALLVGAFASCLLLGITITQLHFYLDTFSKDSRWIKILAVYIFVVGTLHTCLQCHALYFYLVSHYADPTVLDNETWSLVGIPLLEALIGGPVEIFFALYIWKLSEGSLLGTAASSAIFIISSLRTCLGVATTSMTFLHRSNIRPEIMTGLVSAATADVSIATCMLFLLLSQRAIFLQPRSFINKLIMCFIGTGLLTALWSIAVLIIFFAVGGNMVFTGVRSVLPKLYAIGMMVVLNSREGAAHRQSDGLTVQRPTALCHPTEVTITTDRPVVESHYIPISRLSQYRSSSYAVPLTTLECNELEKKKIFASVY